MKRMRLLCFLVVTICCVIIAKQVFAIDVYEIIRKNRVSEEGGFEDRDFTESAQKESILESESLGEVDEESPQTEDVVSYMQDHPDDVYANNTVCPVLKEPVTVETGLDYAYKGVIYYFCSIECIVKFKTNPQKYVNELKALEKKLGTSKGTTKKIEKVEPFEIE